MVLITCRCWGKSWSTINWGTEALPKCPCISPGIDLIVQFWRAVGSVTLTIICTVAMISLPIGSSPAPGITACLMCWALNGLKLLWNHLFSYFALIKWHKHEQVCVCVGGVIWAAVCSQVYCVWLCRLHTEPDSWSIFSKCVTCLHVNFRRHHRLKCIKYFMLGSPFHPKKLWF